MDVQACLRRIRYEGPVNVSFDTLKNLQLAFMLAVPFENLDIHIGRRIEIASDCIYRKVVESRRGGFCFELNGLFHDLLTAIGFDVKFLSARMIRPGDNCPESGHMTLRVDLDAPWLVDVGNGKSFREPLRMDGAREASAEGAAYRVEGNRVFETGPDGAWQPRYVFSTEPRSREHFREACTWTQTSPESVFTKNRMCTLARERGRVTLMNSTLSITDEIRTDNTEIRQSDFSACLETHFGIVLPSL